MHVLYFHQHFSTPKGSAGIRSYQMARALLNQGHQVTMVCGSYRGGHTGLDGPFQRGRREGFVDNIRVIEFNLNYSNADGFFRRFLTFIKFAMASIFLAMREKYDVIFATTTPLTVGIPGIFARWLRRKPFVFEVRDLWPELPREMGVITNPVILSMMAALEWVSYRSAHRCIALSPGIAKGIIRCGVEPEKIAVIPNGCDIDIFGSLNLTEWRPEGVAKSDLMAVFAGTQGQANGLDAVLDAARVLQERDRRDIKIVLIGQGKLTKHLKARVEDEKLENVIFHPPVPKDELSALMASTDIGLQCLANIPAFYFGTSPNKFFDYIASGLPVLNNYPGWLAEMIAENDCGYVVPPENTTAFADALEHAAENRGLLKTKGKNSASLARRQFDRKDLASIWVSYVIYGELEEGLTS